MHRSVNSEGNLVLAEYCPEVLGAAVAEIEQIRYLHFVCLGCDHNRYAVGRASSPTALVPGGPLPAADAFIMDCEGARMHMDWLSNIEVTRQAGWLLHEMDEILLIPHYRLRELVVEQVSMNDKFDSLRDESHRLRGRWHAGLRFRWDRWRHRTIEVLRVTNN